MPKAGGLGGEWGVVSAGLGLRSVRMMRSGEICIPGATTVSTALAMGNRGLSRT